MRVLVVRAGGAIGRTAGAAAGQPRARGDRQFPGSASRRPNGCARSAPSPSCSTCWTPAAVRAGRTPRPGPRPSSTRRPRWPTAASRGRASTAAFAPDQPAAHRGHRQTCWPPRGRRACAGSSRRASRRTATCARGGPVKTEDDPLERAIRRGQRAADFCRDEPPRPGGPHGRRHRAPLRRLLRRSTMRWSRRVRKRQYPIVGDGCGGHAVHPPARRRRGHRARPGPCRPGHLQHHRRRARRGPGLAAGAGRGARREAAPARAHLAGPADRRRRAGHDDPVPGCGENDRARKEFGWTLRSCPSGRQGFPASYRA